MILKRVQLLINFCLVGFYPSIITNHQQYQPNLILLHQKNIITSKQHKLITFGNNGEDNLQFKRAANNSIA